MSSEPSDPYKPCWHCGSEEHLTAYHPQPPKPKRKKRKKTTMMNHDEFQSRGLLPGQMVHCNGCGFYCVSEDARTPTEYDESSCETCKLCEEEPRFRESYRRGFNAGLDRLAEAVEHVARSSNLRKK
jgi:hypothetical protein